MKLNPGEWNNVNMGAILDLKCLKFEHRQLADLGNTEWRGIISNACRPSIRPCPANTNTCAEPMPRDLVVDVRPKGLLTPQVVEERLSRKGWALLGKGMRSRVFAHPKHPLIVVKICHTPDPWPDYIHWALSKGELGKQAPMVWSIAPLDPGYVAVVERLFERPRGVEWGCQFSKDIYSEANARRTAQAFVFEDLGCFNVMQRSNGDVVFNDPWCGNALKAVKPWTFKGGFKP